MIAMRGAADRRDRRRERIEPVGIRRVDRRARSRAPRRAACAAAARACRRDRRAPRRRRDRRRACTTAASPIASSLRAAATSSFVEQRKRHRRRRVEHDRRRQDGAIGGETDVRAIAAREQPPIDAARIVALAIEPILGELGRRPAHLRVMRARRSRPSTARRAGQCTPRTASSSGPRLFIAPSRALAHAKR